MYAARHHGRNDRGHSMVEVLVTVGLLVLVTGIVYGVINQTQQVTRTGSAAAFSQTQMNDAVSRFSRDVSVAKRIAVATPSTLALESVSSAGCRFTEYLIGDGDNDGTADDLISRNKVDTVCVANRTTLATDPTVKKIMIVKNLKDALLPGVTVFRYFDLTDKPLATVTDPSQVGRVEIDVAADVQGRTSPVRLTTSAAPRTGTMPVGSGTANALPPPAASSDVTDSYSCAATQVVSWSRPPGATGYAVTVDGSAFAFPGDNDPAITSVSVPVSPGQTRNVSVSTKGVGGTSTPSNAVVVRCPGAPTLTGTTIARDGDGYVNDNRLTWTAVSGAANYIVYRAGTSAATLPSTTLTWDDPNRAWGSSTAYYVIAVNQGGSGANSNTVTRSIAPAAPTLTGSHANGDRTLNWTAPTSTAPIVGYQLQRRYTGTTTWTSVYNGTARTYLDAATINADTFDYQVRADNTNANGGGWSAWDSISLQPRPVAPAISGVAYDGPYNDITWALVANATAYDIYRGGTLLANLGNVGTYRDSAVAWASTQSYTVVATNKTGASPQSNTVTLLQFPGPFSITAANGQQWGHYKDEKDVMWKDQDGGMYADWSASSGASDYDVTFDGVNYPMTGTATRYPASGYNVATPGNVYTVRVTAKAANGRTRSAATKDVMIPPTPPKDVWGATYCHSTYNANGWKFGMRWNNYPYAGYASTTELTETKFRLANVGAGTSGGYDYFTNRPTVNYSMLNSTRETAWGGITDNTDLISNNAGEGGGYALQNFKTGTFDFGRDDSFKFSMTGFKTATGPVACAAGTSTWDYNGNSGTIQRWYVAF